MVLPLQASTARTYLLPFTHCLAGGGISESCGCLWMPLRCGRMLLFTAKHVPCLRPYHVELTASFTSRCAFHLIYGHSLQSSAGGTRKCTATAAPKRTPLHAASALPKAKKQRTNRAAQGVGVRTAPIDPAPANMNRFTAYTVLDAEGKPVPLAGFTILDENGKPVTFSDLMREPLV